MPTSRLAGTTVQGNLVTDDTLDLYAGFIGFRATGFDLNGIPVATTVAGPGPFANEIIGSTGNDEGLFGTNEDDAIHGLQGDDYLYGLAGNDILDGGTGTDVMAGGTGNDTYYVDRHSDVVWEWGGQGIDTVRTSVSTYILPTAVENLDVFVLGDASGFGNELDNTIRGDGEKDFLHGRTGNDTIFGQGGNDFLHGDEGNDLIDGGSGNDYMQGGSGNDIYFVDSFSDSVDEITASMDAGGIDLVRSTVSHTLDLYVENLELIGSGYSQGTGNSLDNVITGNAAPNVIIGMQGADRMFGGAGADTFRLTAVGDAAPLGAGFTDYLPDFSEAQGDKIDLSAIDANVFAVGDQAFTPIGVNVAFNGVAGELRFNGGLLEGDVNGDRVADFQIQLDVAGISAAGLVA